MKIRVNYSQIELDATIEFVAKNNPNFLGRYSHIRDSIIETINHIIKSFPDIHGEWQGTMGYYVCVEEVVVEGIDHDHNSIMISFKVDPALSSDSTFLDDDIQFFEITK